MLQETIVAISTALAPAAIGIVRLSGPQAIYIADIICWPVKAQMNLTRANSHHLYQARIHNASGDVLDDCLVVVMRSPHSYTGEDMVEFHCHGSPMVLRQVLELCITAGARTAGPGEFTRRAFFNGKLDLIQVEAVGDLLDAASSQAAVAAAQQLVGGLSKQIEAVRSVILGFLAHVQAAIDYPEDVPDLAPKTWLDQTDEMMKELQQLIAGAQRGIQVRVGIDAVLIGRPNVGKSSLLNMLLATERAIVTPMAGTTRDVIEESIEIAGVSFRLSDTAGLRQEGQQLEMIGMERTRQRMSAANLLLAVFDGSQEFNEDDKQVLAATQGRKAIAVVNKSDLPQRFPKERLANLPVVHVSALHGDGQNELEQTMAQVMQLTGDYEVGVPPALVTRSRQVGALRGALAALQRVQAGVAAGITADCLALELEDALWHLGELTGASYRDELLDEIFSRFCVGK